MLAVRRVLLQGACAFLLLICATAHAEDWQPISQDELHMKSTPKAPSAPAIFLYREVNRDDNASLETVYERIKILNEEGRNNANIEIPYLKGTEAVRSIHARTIKPDGTIVNFDGQIFDKSLVKVGGIKYQAKTFTLPNAEVGSIIEYRYSRDGDPLRLFNSHWILSDRLFTLHAKFSLLNYERLALRYEWPAGLPPGTNPPKRESGKLRMEVFDVPAFAEEEYMPPENELKFRVEFIYVPEELEREKTAVDYWKKVGKMAYKDTDKFLDEQKAMKEALTHIISPSDSAEEKLRKIYARTQEIRNLSFEPKQTEQDTKRENLKTNDDVSDVWKHGYGDGGAITWLFLALTRAAGFEAYPAFVSTRNEYFFNANLMNGRQLNDNVAVVRLDGKELYFDPGSKFTPYGLLSWYETGVKALKLDKEGGQWLSTPLPGSADTHIERVANLKLSSAGALEGTLNVKFTGQRALTFRRDEQFADAAERKQYLEDEVKSWLSPSAQVQLTNSPDWGSSSMSLEATFDLQIPDAAASAGSRLLLQTGVFGGQERSIFVHNAREYPVYFRYPSEVDDDIKIDMPKDYKASSLPQARTVDKPPYAYVTSFTESNGTLKLTRRLRLDMLIVPVKAYGTLQDFFQNVRTGDQDQAVLTRAAATAGH
jgi:hypothetical protein